MLGLTLWPLGYPDKARDAAATALTWAGEIQHAMTTGFALCFGLALWGQSGIDPSPSGDLGEAALAYCLERDLRAYIPWAQFYRGLKLVRRAEYAEGLEEMDAAIEAAQKIHTRMFMPGHLGHLAWARAKTGDLESGLCLLAKAIEDVNEKGERVFEAELHRLRGDFFARSGRVSECETEFTNALEIARLQRAKSLELRAAMSLARLRRDQGRRTEAADLLAPVYGWFTEGFATDDLRQAKALLEEVN
jgi:predicted ATPase